MGCLRLFQSLYEACMYKNNALSGIDGKAEDKAGFQENSRCASAEPASKSRCASNK